MSLYQRRNGFALVCLVAQGCRAVVSNAHSLVQLGARLVPDADTG